jgi:hypothetical protein
VAAVPEVLFTIPAVTDSPSVSAAFELFSSECRNDVLKSTITTFFTLRLTSTSVMHIRSVLMSFCRTHYIVKQTTTGKGKGHPRTGHEGPGTDNHKSFKVVHSMHFLDQCISLNAQY